MSKKIIIITVTAIITLGLIGGGVVWYLSRVYHWDWNKYENEEYGFQFEYPKGWDVATANNLKGVFLLRTPQFEGYGATESIYGRGSDVSIAVLDKKFAESIINKSHPWFNKFSYDEKYRGDWRIFVFPGIQQSGPDFTTTSYYLVHNANKIVISVGFTDQDVSFYKDTIEQIIQSIDLFSPRRSLSQRTATKD